MTTVDDKIKLTELCDLISQQVDPQAFPGHLYIGLEHITSGRLIRSGGATGAEVRSSKFAFKKNDVLYGKLRPYLDKAVLADTDGVSTTELLVLRAKQGIDPRFLACVVHSSDFLNHAISGTTGAQHPRTSWAHIAQFELPDYSQQEQSAIADLMWQTHDLLITCEQALSSAYELKRAAMHALLTSGLYGGPQTETEIGPAPADWKPSTLAEVCAEHGGRIQTGPFGSQLHAHEYENEGIPVVNPTHLEGNRINHEDIPKISTKTAARLDRHQLERGDILFARRGEIGRLGLVGEAEVGWLCGTGCFVVRARNPTIDNAFLARLFSTEGVVSWLVAHAAGTIMPNLNNAVLSKLPVLIPELSEQMEIIAILDAIDNKIQLHKQKHSLLEQLFKALLHNFVTGEIRISQLDLSNIESNVVPQEVLA